MKSPLPLVIKKSSKAGESENDYDALEEISEILKETFLKMEILVEEILEKNCECKNNE